MANSIAKEIMSKAAAKSIQLFEVKLTITSDGAVHGIMTLQSGEVDTMTKLALMDILADTFRREIDGKISFSKNSVFFWDPTKFQARFKEKGGLTTMHLQRI